MPDRWSPKRAGDTPRDAPPGPHARRSLSGVNRDDLVALKDLVEAGKVKPVIDRTYLLEAVPDAIRYVEAGGVRGKVVITVPA